jgi:hypothetical protein
MSTSPAVSIGCAIDSQTRSDAYSMIYVIDALRTIAGAVWIVVVVDALKTTVKAA